MNGGMCIKFMQVRIVGLAELPSCKANTVQVADRPPATHMQVLAVHVR